MKLASIVVGALALLPVVSGAARADTQVSLDVTGVASFSPLRAVSQTDGDRFLFVTQGADPTVVKRDLILAVDVRPSFGFGPGLRIGVGFRAGRNGSLGGRGGPFGDPTAASLYGGDVSFGFQR